MLNSQRKKLIVIFISVTVLISAVIIAFAVAAAEKIEEPEKWVLHSYGNNVALYNGDEIIEVYGSIILDTLPEEDKKLLDNGISFLTREEAVNAIEDYDG